MKLLGYIISIVGVLILSLTVKPIRDALSLPAAITNTYLSVVGLAVIVIGILLVSKGSSGRKVKEVPIYHGKNIIGFRRMK